MARFLRWGRRSAAAVPTAGSILPGGWLPSAAPVSPMPMPFPEPVDLLPTAEPLAAVAPDPVEQAAPVEPTGSPEEAAGRRVGLVFGDGTHMVLDPDDPRAQSFTALADELNR